MVPFRLIDVINMFINYNGKLVDATQNVLHHSNRGFRYGDGIFESMAMFNKKVKLLDWHARRLQTGANVLEFILPEQLSEINLGNEIDKFREANNFINSRIRIFLFRNSGGFYAPDGNNAGFIIEGESIKNNNYELNKEGLAIGVYKDILKPLNIFSNVKTCNALQFVKAGLYKNKLSLSECILLNEKGQLCEAISTNLFWIKNNKIFMPSENSGCIMGVMRAYLIHYFKENNIEFEEGEYLPEVLNEAEEIFLSSATRGLFWVKELSKDGQINTYDNKITTKLFDSLFNSQ